jgi:hypothetical protein
MSFVLAEHVDGGQAVSDGLCERTDTVPHFISYVGANAVTDGIPDVTPDGITNCAANGISYLISNICADGVPDGIPDVGAHHIPFVLPDGVSDSISNGISDCPSYQLPNRIAHFVSYGTAHC